MTQALSSGNLCASSSQHAAGSHARSGLDQTSAKTRPALPLEVVEQVIHIALNCAPSDSVLRFQTVRSLSQACRAFRRVAIHCHLQELFLASSKQWCTLEKFIAGQPTRYTAVRMITSSATAFASASASASSLTRFNHLKELTMRLDSLILSNSSPFLKKILTTLPNGNILMSITLTSLPVLTPFLLRLIAEAAPRLEYLCLHCLDRLDYCCWACLQDSAECMVHSLIPHMFSDIRSLATSFGAALKPLTKLTNLSLGIFLSDEQFFIQHLHHKPTQPPRTPWWTSSPCSSPLHYSTSIANAPSSDCDFLPVEQDRHQHPHSSNESSPFSPASCLQCQRSPTIEHVAAREDYLVSMLSNSIQSLQQVSICSFFPGRLQSPNVSLHPTKTVHEIRFTVQRTPRGSQVCRSSVASNPDSLVATY